ncbi:hypothetical protein AOV_01195 [Anaplasma ovis str. Haibei]|uniref:Uncharacterized protein n=1 Tax=Anaplasma ovis str. Haibei TaxID=1248439 RepID=A0A2Z2LE72_9RICK|nr:hypothetical protein [Anaplasma ovis]ASI47530.1 hypothetical protein AOV_01195 [Anaplasma ovis str. Haibei]
MPSGDNPAELGGGTVGEMTTKIATATSADTALAHGATSAAGAAVQAPSSAAPSPTAVDQGNETATSPSPSTEGDGSAIQSGSVQHATGSSATLKLKSAPDQAMRDAVPDPWSLINAGKHHSNNSRNAQAGNIREFCSKYLCRGTDKREGLLNFIKASIDTPTSIEAVAGNDAKASMRVTGPKSSDPNQVTSIVVTENHNFIVRGTHNKEVGTLEAEVQYTVTPTIEQDKYTVSDLTVKIKSTDSTDPELTYTSTNTSEVSLPKPEAITAKEGQQNSGGSGHGTGAGTGTSGIDLQYPMSSRMRLRPLRTTLFQSITKARVAQNSLLRIQHLKNYISIYLFLSRVVTGGPLYQDSPLQYPLMLRMRLRPLRTTVIQGAEVLRVTHLKSYILIHSFLLRIIFALLRGLESGQLVRDSPLPLPGVPHRYKVHLREPLEEAQRVRGVLHLAQVEAQKVPPPHRQHPEAYSMAPRLDKHNKRELLRVSQKAS